MSVANYADNLIDSVYNPWWYVVCDLSVLLYGYWTILCHVTVFLEKNLYFLFSLCVLSSILAGALFFTRLRGYFLHKEKAISPRTSSNSKGQNILFWILILSILVLSLISHRADIDDNRYINRAVMIADHPDQPLLVFDGRHKIPNVPIKLSSKLYSSGVLAGALSKITGIPAIYFPHMVFSAFAAILSVMAFGRLFRLLAPDYWAFALLALFVFLISDGMVHRTFGNFSIVRLHQGKGILVSIMVPLIIIYAFDFMRHPIWKTWLLLFFAHIVSIGFSSSALLVAPLTSFFSFIAFGIYAAKMSFHRRLLPGILASIYILIILSGLFYYGQKQWPGKRAFIGVLPPPSPHHEFSISVRQNNQILKKNIYLWNTQLVFGKGRFAIFCGFIVLTAWIWAPTPLAKWFCIVFPLGVAAVFFLPYTSRLVPPSFYWRIYWILPMPVLAGLTLTAPLKFIPLGKRHGFFNFSIFSLILLITFFGISERHIFSHRNYVRMGFPGLKVNSSYEIAQYINQVLDDRPNVLAPSNVCYWLPTFHHHPYPIITRYLADKILGDEAPDRITLTRYIDGSKIPDNADSFFRKQLERFEIQLVCFRTNHPRRTAIHHILKSLAFKKDIVMNHYEIWVR